MSNSQSVSADEVHAQLSAILASTPFTRSKRSSSLLEFLVSQALNDGAQRLKEYVVAVELFGREESFDPRIDSLVRVEATRLRARLKAYYDGPGSADRVRIDLPSGSYVPVFGLYAPPEAPAPLEAPSPPEATLPELRRASRNYWIAIAVVAILGIAWSSVSHLQSTYRRLVRLKRITSGDELSAYPAFSPDGRWIVYSSDRGGGALHLWKQSLEGELSQLTTGDCNETEPDISSDGAWIAYHSDCSGGGVFLMRHSGGDARLIAHFGHSARFSPQGAHLVYWVQNQRTGFGMIYTARLDAPEEPLHVAREFDDAHNPVWTPDGKRLLICGTRRSRKGPDEEHDFWFLTFDGQPATKAGAFEKFAKSAINPHADILPTTSFRWIGDRELLVAIQQAGRSEIRRIVFDSAWRMTSDLPLMTAAMDETIHPFAAGSKLAFSTVRASIGVWSLALSPNEGRVTGGLRRLTGAREAVSPIVSPDGGTLLFSSPDGRRSFVLCKLDSKEGKVTELATLPGPSNRLKISPDGRTVYYRLLEGTGRQNQPIYAADVSSGATRKICSNCGPPTHVSPDGKLVIYEAPNTIARLSAVRVDTGESWVFLEHSHHAVTSGRVSPDGNFIAFQTDRGLDGKQVHVAPFRNAARIDESTWIPITFPDQWSEEPWWSPNGNYLYFLSQRDGWRCVWAQQVDQASMRAVGSPKAIQHFHHPGLNPLTFRNLAPLYVGLSVAQDQLVLSISEIRSNVWTAEIESVR